MHFIILKSQNDGNQWLSDGSRLHEVCFRRGSAADPTWGAYSAPQAPSWFNPLNASWSKLLLFEGFSAILV